MGQLELFVERREGDRWQFVGTQWVPKNYSLFAVLGETETFGQHLDGRAVLSSVAGRPPDPSPEVLRALEDMSEDEDLVRHIGLEHLLGYAWEDGKTTRFLAGALGFHQFETTGSNKRLLGEESEAGAQRLGLHQVSHEEMRTIIRDRPEVLKDIAEKAAGAYTFVDAKSTAARELSFEDALPWLMSRAPAGERDRYRVTMIMSV